MNDGDRLIVVGFDFANVFAAVLFADVADFQVGFPQRESVVPAHFHLSGGQHAGSFLPEQDQVVEVLDLAGQDERGAFLDSEDFALGGDCRRGPAQVRPANSVARRGRN